MHAQFELPPDLYASLKRCRQALRLDRHQVYHLATALLLHACGIEPPQIHGRAADLYEEIKRSGRLVVPEVSPSSASVNINVKTPVLLSQYLGDVAKSLGISKQDALVLSIAICMDLWGCAHVRDALSPALTEIFDQIPRKGAIPVVETPRVSYREPDTPHVYTRTEIPEPLHMLALGKALTNGVNLRAITSLSVAVLLKLLGYDTMELLESLTTINVWSASRFAHSGFDEDIQFQTSIL